MTEGFIARVIHSRIRVERSTIKYLISRFSLMGESSLDDLNVTAGALPKLASLEVAVVNHAVQVL